MKARKLKTKNSRRILPLSPKIRLAIRKHAMKNGVDLPPFELQLKLSIEGTVVVSEARTPLEPRNLNRLFDILIAKAGLPRITIHALRHTAATDMKDLGVDEKDAQLMLGHANIITTKNIYQKGTYAKQCAAIAAMEDRRLGSK